MMLSTPHKKMTLLQYLRDCYAPTRLRLQSQSQEQMAVALRCIERLLGRPPLVGDLCEDFIVGCIRLMVKAGGSPYQTNIRRGYLISLWRHSYRRKLVKASPFEAEIEKVREPKRKPVAWSLADIDRMLATVATHQPRNDLDRWFGGAHWSALILLIYNSGVRIHAALSLKVSDLRGDILTVRPELQKDMEELVVRLPAELVRLLNELHRPDVVRQGRRLSEYLIPFPWSITQASRAFQRRVLTPAGLPNDRRMKFHCLRRTCATLTAAYGSREQAREILGHSSLATTARYLADAHSVDPRITTDASPCLIIPAVQPAAVDTSLPANSTKPGDWSFVGLVKFRGRTIRIRSRCNTGYMLKRLADSPAPVPVSELLSFVERNGDHSQRLMALHEKLSTMRDRLMEDLGLTTNPLPLVNTPTGKSAVTIAIPSEIGGDA